MLSLVHRPLLCCFHHLLFLLSSLLFNYLVGSLLLNFSGPLRTSALIMTWLYILLFVFLMLLTQYFCCSLFQLYLRCKNLRETFFHLSLSLSPSLSPSLSLSLSLSLIIHPDESWRIKQNIGLISTLGRRGSITHTISGMLINILKVSNPQ